MTNDVEAPVMEQHKSHVKTGKEVRLERLVMRLSQRWLFKVRERLECFCFVLHIPCKCSPQTFPHGRQAWRKEPGEEDKAHPCPVWRISLLGDQGRTELVLPQALSPLRVGAQVVLGSESTLSSAHARLKQCFFLPSRREMWHNGQDDFMLVLFSRPTTVFVLLPGLTKEPRCGAGTAVFTKLFFKLLPCSVCTSAGSASSSTSCGAPTSCPSNCR